MRWNEANKQIQAWPTPQVFVRRSGGDSFDYAGGVLALDSFVAVTAQLVTLPTETGSGAFALQSMLVNGKQPISNSDAGAGAFALQSMVAVTAKVVTAPAEAGRGAFALQSMVAVTAQIVTPTPADAGTGRFALQSMVV